jgi:enamine deaminase RidA (YjgF/YER057c/UK114 family)
MLTKQGPTEPGKGSLVSISDRLDELGLQLPPVPVPVANYVAVRRTGDLMFVSGQTPTHGGVLQSQGKLGRDLTVEQGHDAARRAVLNCLAALQADLGSLEKVTAVVKLTGYVASAEGFGDQPMVVNGASVLLEEIFGDIGKHARAALGVAELPGGAPVEVELIVQVRT